MASYRFENSAEEGRGLLVPVSGGVSSISLLHLLEKRLQKKPTQASAPSTEVRVLFVDMSSVEHTFPITALAEALKNRFSQYTYSTVSIEDVFNGTDLSSDNERSAASEDGNMTNRRHLAESLSSLSSATSQADVLGILKVRLIAQVALDHRCRAVLWGDTATRLSERILAQTAKGRGFSIPWHVSDGASPYGVPFYYPLRELLRTELLSFSALVDPPLTPILSSQGPEPPGSASFKNTSLDALMTQYLTSVEEGFPNIVANVVRTSGKLQVPTETSEQRRCSLCAMHLVDEDGHGGISSGCRQDPSHPLLSALGNEAPSLLCHGCSVALSI
ncbi:MAG: cytoplasmic tRNA 2-thiolation protein 2 [Lichina confinis]|nr:MAG: cytoplasmic tRNA 2-thiolation protein 2 [Lichina confinis]